MRCYILAHLLVLTVLSAALPNITEENEKIIVDLDYYADNLIIYEAKYDIIDIIVPLNAISDYESSDTDSGDISDYKKHLLVFFVEADKRGDHYEYHGIHVYKNGKSTRVMDKGKAVAAAADDSKYVFLGAEDGLYVYNPKTQKADKYGQFNRSIKDMAKEQNTDVIYILTDDRELYKVYDAATKEQKIDDVKEAEQIVTDYSNNLYYYGKDKQPYVRNVDGEIKRIEGLPEGAKEVRLMRPPFLQNQGAEFLVDNVLYSIYPDGRSEPDGFEFKPEAAPSAYSMEAAMFRYLGFKKNLYEYDLFESLDSSESESDSKSESKADNKSAHDSNSESGE